MNYIKLVCICILFLFICGCSNDEIVKTTKNYFYMDTMISISLWEDNTSAFSEIELLYETYHNLTSRYDYLDLINVYYINNVLEINEIVTIDNRLYDILSYAKEVYELTSKNVNIALGNVIDVWSSHKLDNTLPTYDELSTSGSVELDDLILLDNNQIMKLSDISLDLGSISKGYTTELIKDILKKYEIDIYLINAGGNVLVGNHYDNDLYKIGLENPEDNLDIYKILNLENKAVVTSGSYERNYEYNGVIYHHIIDNETYFPMNYFKGVTVIADDSALADVLSTYLFSISYEDGLEYISTLENDIDIIWFIDNDNIKITEGISTYE